MAIDVEQIESLATQTIGSDPNNPLYEGDSLEAPYVFAESFDANGQPQGPALFKTDCGGWEAEVIMESPSTLAVTVDNPLANNGLIMLRIAVDESTGKTGKHRGNIRIFNPTGVGPRDKQRVLFNFIISITEEP